MMKPEIEKFIRIIDEAEEELTIRTDRKSHRTEAVTKDGKLYYYINHNENHNKKQ